MTTKECEFCHIEEASEEITGAIDKKDYYILKMEDIPPVCPEQPTRRQLILHIRANDQEQRFADFKECTEEQLIALKENIDPIE